jgi:heptosyltransferase II
MKILVRAPNWLGDAIMAMPFLKRLKERSPGADIDVVCKDSLAGFFAGAPAVRRSISLTSADASPAALRKERYEEAFALPSSFSSAWHLFRTGAAKRTGHAAEGRSLLLTKAFPVDERYHYVRRYLQLIGEEGREVLPGDLYFPAGGPLPPAFPAGGPTLAVAPGSRAPARRWPADRFAAVVDQWKGPAVILGAPDDAPWARAVAKAVKRPVADFCGKTSLPVLGAVLKACAALVTNESGLMHAAWALGVPTVVVAGPSEPRCTSPFGSRVTVLQRRDLPCVPCVRNECFRPAESHMACLTGLSPAQVISALPR